MTKKISRTKPKQKPAPPSPAGTAPRIDPDPIGPGDVVMLPDGATAAVDKIVGTDAYVIEWTKQLGRGPWIYPLADLVRIT